MVLIILLGEFYSRVFFEGKNYPCYLNESKILLFLPLFDKQM
jgi:hypothetical protein